MSQNQNRSTSRGSDANITTFDLDSVTELASLHSALLNHPLCPVAVYNVIADHATPLEEEVGARRSAPEIDSLPYVTGALVQRAQAGLIDMA